jgi:hypothetical protein
MQHAASMTLILLPPGRMTGPSAQNRELQAIDWCALVFSDSICGYQTRQALVGIMG